MVDDYVDLCSSATCRFSGMMKDKVNTHHEIVLTLLLIQCRLLNLILLRQEILEHSHYVLSVPGSNALEHLLTSIGDHTRTTVESYL